jgi:hypothetical protein
MLLGSEPLAVEWGGMTINLECCPRAFTTELEKEFQDTSTNGEGLVLLVSRLVKSWDLLEDDAADAKPYPLTPEALSRLPIAFLAAVAEQITRLLNPNSVMRKTSSSAA